MHASDSKTSQHHQPSGGGGAANSGSSTNVGRLTFPAQQVLQPTKQVVENSTQPSFQYQQILVSQSPSFFTATPSQAQAPTSIKDTQQYRTAGKTALSDAIRTPSAGTVHFQQTILPYSATAFDKTLTPTAQSLEGQSDGLKYSSQEQVRPMVPAGGVTSSMQAHQQSVVFQQSNFKLRPVYSQQTPQTEQSSSIAPSGLQAAPALHEISMPPTVGPNTSSAAHQMQGISHVKGHHLSPLLGQSTGNFLNVPGDQSSALSRNGPEGAQNVTSNVVPSSGIPQFLPTQLQHTVGLNRLVEPSGPGQVTQYITQHSPPPTSSTTQRVLSVPQSQDAQYQQVSNQERIPVQQQYLQHAPGMPMLVYSSDYQSPQQNSHYVIADQNVYVSAATSNPQAQFLTVPINQGTQPFASPAVHQVVPQLPPGFSPGVMSENELGLGGSAVNVLQNGNTVAAKTCRVGGKDGTRVKYLCRYQGCRKQAKGKGMCIAHGGGKRCVREGCNKIARFAGSICHDHHKKRQRGSADTVVSSPNPTSAS